MKKQLAWILSLLLTAALLFGCGAQANESYDVGADKNAAGTVGDSLTQESNTEANEPSDTPQNQKLIRTIWLDAETEDLDTVLAQIDKRIAELEGYMEQREVNNGSAYSGRRYRNANLTIRIPADKLDGFIDQVSETTNITSTNETTENITLSYVATQSRITALETEQTRLLELLAQAESMDDLLKIESRLTEVRTELEKVSSQLRLYDNLVDYGTIHLNISEVYEYTVVEEPETVWERIGSGLKNSFSNLGDFLTELFIFLVVSFPYFAILGVAAACIVVPIRLRAKKKRKLTEKENKE